MRHYNNLKTNKFMRSETMIKIKKVESQKRPFYTFKQIIHLFFLTVFAEDNLPETDYLTVYW
jgi:hypothetical protein